MYDENQQSGYNQNQQGNANQPTYQSPPPQYSPPPPQQYNGGNQWPPMKIGDWAVVWLISLIPIVNLVMMFVWGLSSDVNPSKKAYFQWQLIVTAIGIVISILFAILFGTVLAALISGLGSAFS